MCELTEEHLVLDGPSVRVNDIELGKASYSPGDEMEATVRGVIVEGCLEHPRLSVEATLDGVTMGYFYYDVCELDGASCPSCEGDEYAFTIRQEIPNRRFLRGKTLVIESKLHEGPHVVSCTSMDLVLADE